MSSAIACAFLLTMFCILIWQLCAGAIEDAKHEKLDQDLNEALRRAVEPPEGRPNENLRKLFRGEPHDVDDTHCAAYTPDEQLKQDFADLHTAVHADAARYAKAIREAEELRDKLEEVRYARDMKAEWYAHQERVFESIVTGLEESNNALNCSLSVAETRNEVLSKALEREIGAHDLLKEEFAEYRADAELGYDTHVGAPTEG